MGVLTANRFRARACNVESVNPDSASGVVFSSKGGGVTYRVDLRRQFCSCGMFQATSIPCKHAIALCMHPSVNLEARSFVDECLTMRGFRAFVRLAGTVPQVASAEVARDVLQPPVVQRLPGRPKKRRARSRGEEGPGAPQRRRQCCSQCGAVGHKKQTCRASYRPRVRVVPGAIVDDEDGE